MKSAVRAKSNSRHHRAAPQISPLHPLPRRPLLQCTSGALLRCVGRAAGYAGFDTEKAADDASVPNWPVSSHLYCVGVKLFMMSKVQFVFCFENCTTEGRRGEKGGSAKF